MKKTILPLLFVFLTFIIGCANEEIMVKESPDNKVQEKPIQPAEEIAAVPEEPQLIEQAQPATGEAESAPLPEPKLVDKAVKDPKCNREFSPQFNAAPYYNGLLFDAHFHMPPNFEEEHEEPTNRFPEGFRMPVLGEDITLQDILCLFDKERVNGAFAFYQWNYESLDESMQYAADMKKQLPAGVHLFLAPLELGAEELDDIVISHPGVFDGFGEITFYDPERTGTTPDDPMSLEINNVAEKHNLVVMFHPNARQETKIENALEKNQNVKFLLHGPELEDTITNLIEKYPNLYYSIDTILIRKPGSVGPLMYTAPSKEAYKSELTHDFDKILDDAVKKWKSRIENHPDRFMWGTDRAGDWTFDEEVSTLIEEFTRAFIAQIDPAVQEQFAYKNAENLFKSNS